MAETFPEIIEGALDVTTEIEECVANGVIDQWAPVVLVAPGTGEKLPRVGTTTTLGDKNKYGVKVAPNKTLAAGDICYIAKGGRTKVKIAAAVSRGDTVVTGAAAGKANKVIALDAPATYVEADVQTELNKIAAALGEYLEDGAADGDIIVMDVRRSPLS